jgi:flagellar assembly protein FliH
MAAIQKFLFETVFDDENGVVIAAPVAETSEQALDDEAIIEEEVVPTFSEEEVAAAQQQGFAAGREEGQRVAMESTESRLAEAFSVVAERIGGLFEIQAQANLLAAADAVSVATTMVRKIFSDLARRSALGEIENMVETAMHRVMDEPRLIIRVNEALLQDAEERLAAVVGANGYEGRLVILGDDEIDHGNCRIEWTDGGAERDTAALWQELDSIIEQNLGRAGDRAADGAPAAHPSETMAVGAEIADPPDEGTTDPTPDDVKEKDGTIDDPSGPVSGIDQPAPISGIADPMPVPDNAEPAPVPGDVEPTPVPGDAETAPVPGDSTRDN